MFYDPAFTVRCKARQVDLKWDNYKGNCSMRFDNYVVNGSNGVHFAASYNCWDYNS